jgi:hypothetical protein
MMLREGGWGEADKRGCHAGGQESFSWVHDGRSVDRLRQRACQHGELFY